MISSMTGYSRHESEGLTWEIRSVNGRGLEVSMHLPKILSDLEPDLRTAVRSRLSRGSVQVWLSIDASEPESVNEVNYESLNQLMDIEKVVANRYPDLGRPCTLDLLNWPGVLVTHNSRTDPKKLASIRRSFEKALDEFQLHRFREGSGLADVVSERLGLIAQLLSQIQEHAAKQVDQVRHRLVSKLERLNVAVDPSRMEQEVALSASRSDFAEELDRLSLHLREFRDCLSGEGPHGRRLSFLTQELLREVNTLGAKAILPECATMIVDLKLNIDQIREQVANIE